VLLIFDSVVEYELSQKKSFDLVNQPFSPTNIVNEIMENTGCFNVNVSTIFIYDTNIMNFNYDVYQKYF